MDWIRIERWAIVLAATAAGVFARLNLGDEFETDWGYADFLAILGAWFLFPSLNALIGCRAKRPGLVRTSLVLALLFAYFYSHYAFNGSIRDRIGGQHMHLAVVPIESAILFVSVHALGLMMPTLRRMINRPFQSS